MQLQFKDRIEKNEVKMYTLYIKLFLDGFYIFKFTPHSSVSWKQVFFEFGTDVHSRSLVNDKETNIAELN